MASALLVCPSTAVAFRRPVGLFTSSKSSSSSSRLPRPLNLSTIRRPLVIRAESAFAGTGGGPLGGNGAGEGRQWQAGAAQYDGTGKSAATYEAPPSAEKKERRLGFLRAVEDRVERTIFDFRFMTLFGVFGSLLGAVLCFLKGCLFVGFSYRDYIKACMGGTHTSRVILYLVEAVDVYLMGTVMLIFGMGLYELFVSSLEVPSIGCADGVGTVCNSNLFGLFRLTQRPKWLEIRSLDELKTKLGHVIVMILLVGLFEKSKKVVVHTATDFLCFSASILFSAGALYLLSMLTSGADDSALNRSLKSA